MQKINFQNLPNQTTPISAQNLNAIQDNTENAIKEVTNVELLAVTNTPPIECSIGDKYYNTTTKKIYIATDTDTWSITGEDPISGIFYIVFDEQKSYSWDGTDLISVDGGSTGGLTFDDIYPIGSIYLSVNSTNPSTLFGGTWEQIQDKFLLSAGTTYTAGSTGGASSVNYTPAGTNKNGAVQSHTLTIDEIPSHSHSYSMSYWDGWKYGDGDRSNVRNANQSENTSSVGGGQGHTHNFTQPTFTGTQATINTMPPYLAVYVWKRTA